MLCFIKFLTLLFEATMNVWKVSVLIQNIAECSVVYNLLWRNRKYYCADGRKNMNSVTLWICCVFYFLLQLLSQFLFSFNPRFNMRMNLKGFFFFFFFFFFFLTKQVFIWTHSFEISELMKKSLFVFLRKTYFLKLIYFNIWRTPSPSPSAIDDIE